MEYLCKIASEMAMKILRFFPQGVRLYINRLKGVVSHLSCDDIDSGMVNTSALLGRHVKVGYDVKISHDVEIGRYTYIENFSTINCAIIGNFCSIGERCVIGPWNHNYRMTSNSPIVYRNILSTEYNDKPKPAKIGNDVWIGSGAVIMGGVAIGNGAIVGAGSVVTKNVEPYSIVVGNPAFEIGKRFSNDRIRSIDASMWWDWTEDRIRENKGFFIADDK